MGRIDTGMDVIVQIGSIQAALWGAWDGSVLNDTYHLINMSAHSTFLGPVFFPQLVQYQIVCRPPQSQIISAHFARCLSIHEFNIQGI